ncbi:hypothetical protein Pan258_46130 [Symmachiella dynata]|uniref:hypothetical protein n=1 Tax=Symmachiella dynata TaxID=2527995 RepID=UPI00118BB526|nr:hypothetical protein [Symmachiella dynata]QDT50534.1 hypothetical protein Pan258_46130 [Symmachiella dynata]
MRFITLTIIVMAMMTLFTGCVTAQRKSEAYQKWADIFERKSQKLRESEAERLAAKEEEARCEEECCCEPKRAKGQITDTTQTEVRFLLENDVTLTDYGLDFDAIEKMAARQKSFDDDYKKALDAYHKMEDERYRRYKAQQLQGKGGSAPSSDPTSCDCVRELPGCAYPPPKPYVKSPPPMRRSLGLEEIPLVIRAQAKFDVGQFAMHRARVKQGYIPGKQPCCPRCGVSGCVERCDSCGYEPSTGRAAYGADVPPAPPAIDDDEINSASFSREQPEDLFAQPGEVSLSDGK